MVHALLANPVSTVGIDVLPDGPGDFAVVALYDGNDNLIGTATTNPGATISLALSAPGIRGVRFAGSGTHFCRFDNFRVVYSEHVIDFDHDPVGNSIAAGTILDNTPPPGA
jgi:hypothetical protein